jgi:hypothetical protein
MLGPLGRILSSLPDELTSYIDYFLSRYTQR